MLGFQCDCSIDVDEPPRVQRSTVRKARKQHECIECRRGIEPGERYEVCSGIDYDGHAFDHKMRLGCRNIREHFCSGGWCVGMIWEQIHECLGFDYRDDPSEWEQEDVDEEDEANRQYVTQLAARQPSSHGRTAHENRG